MKSSMKRNVLSQTLLTLFIAALPASAQYAGIPGDIPPIPGSYQLDVSITQPCSSAFSIPGITDEEAERMENPDETQILFRRDGIIVACLDPEYHDDITYVFEGEWGLNYEIFDWSVCISQLSPSGKYYAVGGDGTGTSRGPVYIIDLETGVKYCSTASDVWGCSDWIEGDYLLIESAGGSDSVRDMWSHGDIGNMPWINYSYMTEAEGRSNDIVLYHDGSSWMILPEDRYYNYRISGIPGSYENGIIFDVAASPNVIPFLAGIASYSDFSEWIESEGGYDAVFPEFDFRVYVDTRTNSVSDIRQMTPGMVVEGYLNAVKGGSIYWMLDYLSLTWTQRNAIRNDDRETVENMLLLFSALEYRICEVSEDGDRADVACELTLLGYRAVNRFTLVNDNGKWRIDDWKIDDDSSVISGNSTAGWFSPLIETILKAFSSMILGHET